MAADSFFKRWSKLKTEHQASADLSLPHASDASHSSNPVELPESATGKQPATLPTLDDVSHLTKESDYSVFMQSGVDEAVKRNAMKKLFSDPHFNVMDGLDIYIDDYNKFTPVSPAMLAALNHAKALLNPPGLTEVLAEADRPSVQTSVDNVGLKHDGKDTEGKAALVASLSEVEQEVVPSADADKSEHINQDTAAQVEHPINRNDCM